MYKTMFPFAGIESPTGAEHEERQLALEYLADAWNEATTDGLESEALAHAALFAALATLVRNYGEENVAQLAEKLAERIRAGEYTLDRSIQ